MHTDYFIPCHRKFSGQTNHCDIGEAHMGRLGVILSIVQRLSCISIGCTLYGRYKAWFMQASGFLGDQGRFRSVTSCRWVAALYSISISYIQCKLLFWTSSSCTNELGCLVFDLALIVFMTSNLDSLSVYRHVVISIFCYVLVLNCGNSTRQLESVCCQFNSLDQIFSKKLWMRARLMCNIIVAL